MLGIGRLKELIKAEKKKELEFHLNDILEIVILWKYIVALHIYICTLVLRYLKEPEDIGKVFKKLQTHDYDGSITLIKLYKRSLSILTSESLSKSTTNGLIREFSSIETVLDVGSVDKWFSNKKLSEVFLIILLSRFYSYDEQDDDDASFSPPSAFSPPPSSSSSSPPPSSSSPISPSSSSSSPPSAFSPPSASASASSASNNNECSSGQFFIVFFYIMVQKSEVNQFSPKFDGGTNSLVQLQKHNPATTNVIPRSIFGEVPPQTYHKRPNSNKILGERTKQAIKIFTKDDKPDIITAMFTGAVIAKSDKLVESGILRSISVLYENNRHSNPKLEQRLQKVSVVIKSITAFVILKCLPGLPIGSGLLINVLIEKFKRFLLNKTKDGAKQLLTAQYWRWAIITHENIINKPISKFKELVSQLNPPKKLSWRQLWELWKLSGESDNIYPIGLGGKKIHTRKTRNYRERKSKKSRNYTKKLYKP